MIELTEQQITKINEQQDHWNQGLFIEPWAIDQNEKRLVIYQRIETGGASGGSCWGTEPTPYTNSDAANEMADWKVLDDTLSELAPNITYLQYKRLVSTLAKDNETSQYEYYGNYTDYFIRWIVVDELIEYLEEHDIH